MYSQGTSIAINDSPSGPPAWLRILSLGSLSTRDGRGPFLVADPDSIIQATLDQAMKLGLPVDLDHSTEWAPKGSPSPAAGWITALERRSDGIYGEISWTTLGREALAWGPNNEPPKWRYISPVFLYDQTTNEVQAILRAGLTNAPNMTGTEICSRKSPMTIAEKIEQLRTELAASSSRLAPSEAEMKAHEKMRDNEVAQHFVNVSEDGFQAAAAKRAKRDARSREIQVDGRPFVMATLPKPKFVGLR
jgi:phage I-like protein